MRTIARHRCGGRGLKRTLFALAGIGIFLGIASVIKPAPRAASAGNLSAREVARTDRHPRGWRLIGTLEGKEHALKCWSTPEGPRFSVFTRDGRLLQDDLPADEVYRGFPDLDVMNLHSVVEERTED